VSGTLQIGMKKNSLAGIAKKAQNQQSWGIPRTSSYQTSPSPNCSASIRPGKKLTCRYGQDKHHRTGVKIVLWRGAKENALAKKVARGLTCCGKETEGGPQERLSCGTKDKKKGLRLIRGGKTETLENWAGKRIRGVRTWSTASLKRDRSRRSGRRWR